MQSNIAIDPVPFGHWTSRDEAAQRRSALCKGQHPVRVRASVLCLAVLLSACASRAPFHTEPTVGRVTEVVERDGGPSGPIVRTLVLPVDGIFVPITVSSAKATSPFYTYKLTVASGRTIQTQSTKEFQLNQCVCLWHAPRTDNSSSEYNFVPGTLEASNECV